MPWVKDLFINKQVQENLHELQSLVIEFLEDDNKHLRKHNVTTSGQGSKFKFMIGSAD